MWQACLELGSPPLDGSAARHRRTRTNKAPYLNVHPLPNYIIISIMGGPYERLCIPLSLWQSIAQSNTTVPRHRKIFWRWLILHWYLSALKVTAFCSITFSYYRASVVNTVHQCHSISSYYGFIIGKWKSLVCPAHEPLLLFYSRQRSHLPC